MLGERRCRTCWRPVLAARIAGTLVDLDPERIEPHPGCVAFNPRTGGGHELSPGEDPVRVWWRWAYAGVTFHRPHAQDCVNRQQTRLAV